MGVRNVGALHECAEQSGDIECGDDVGGARWEWNGSILIGRGRDQHHEEQQQGGEAIDVGDEARRGA